MRSLAQVLHEAAKQNATEIILEAGELPMIRTAAGSVALGDVFGESELFDALGGVLGPDQQAELAVGSVVEFHIDSGSTRWSLITEAGAQGIVIRGRSSNSMRDRSEVGIPLDLPPLEHSDLDSDGAPDMHASVLNRATRRTVLDLAASRLDEEPPGPSDASEPSGRPSWLESNEFDDGPRPQASIDFELRDSDPPTEGIELPDVSEDFGALVQETPDRTGGSVADHLGRLTPGTLCLLHRPPGRERIAVPGTTLVETSTSEASLAGALAREGVTWYLSLEDPSERLGWILRRLEEGARVIVETRALSLEGARRVLLGVNASPRAEAWLSAHRVCWLVARDGGWVLEG